MARPKRNDQWKHVDGGHAFVIPYTLLRHPNFTRLSCHGNKLIMDLGRQYSGFNNGYLCPSWSLMKNCGWSSPTTLRHAYLECEHYRLVVRTRQGGTNKCNLCAFTWWPIHEKPGKDLDVLPTMGPSNAWKEDRPVFEPPKRQPKHERETKRRRLPRAA